MTALVKHINSPTRSIDNVEIAILNQRVTQLKNELSKLNREIKNIHQDTTNRQFLIPSNDGYRYVSLQEVVYCEAEGNYTTIYLTDGTTWLVSKTLKKISETLNTNTFIRCHQSYLINKIFINKIVNFTCEIKSDNHQLCIPISRRKFSDVIDVIGTLF